MQTTLDKLARDLPATLVDVAGFRDDGLIRDDLSLEHRDIARRLVELGFVNGESVRVIRRAFPFGDPIAVRIGATTLALRRFEAALVTVRTA
ncbi:MAG: FeoA domain-containing protein [Burkholderiaceae bacterium]